MLGYLFRPLCNNNGGMCTSLVTSFYILLDGCTYINHSQGQDLVIDQITRKAL